MARRRVTAMQPSVIRSEPHIDGLCGAERRLPLKEPPLERYCSARNHPRSFPRKREPSFLQQSLGPRIRAYALS